MRYLTRLSMLAGTLLLVAGSNRFAAMVSAAPQTAEGTIEIDRPGILDRSGATYRLTRDVSAPRTAFMVKGDGITLDLGGHTVTYGTAIGVDRCHGVFLRPTGGEDAFAGVPSEGFGGGNGFTLRNGRIVQGQQPVAPPGALRYRSGRIVGEKGDHPKPGRYCHAVYIRGCDRLSITGVTTEVNSRDSNNMHLLYCGQAEIARNRCISTVREITNRHWPGTQVICAGPLRGPLEIHHNEIRGGGQWGIYVTGTGNTGHLADVHHNLIEHRSYTTNGYALGCHAPNMRVYANVVKSIGRGAHLTARNIDFYNNIIEPREKPNPEYPKTRTHGIKLEGPSGVLVHHNFCRVVAEEGFGDADPLDLDCPRHAANRIFRNTIEAVRHGDEHWAASVNVVRAEPLNATVLHDNLFRTNHWHVRGDWGGMQDLLFQGNRFEVIGQPADYAFLALRQSSSARTADIVLRNNRLTPPADYRKLHLLYARRYTRANLQASVQGTIRIATVDPAGKAVPSVRVVARDRDGETVAHAITDSAGQAELVLAELRLVGNRGQTPVLDGGPYDLTFYRDDQAVHQQTVDPRDTTELRVELADPDRKLYVCAGEDQRLATGDPVRLKGRVTVIGDARAEAAVHWKIVRGVGDPQLAQDDSATTTLTFEQPGESWLQLAELELVARWQDETATDRVTIRQDTAIRPAAVIVAPERVQARTIVQLDASRSRDPRGFPDERIRYRWRQTAGPPVSLSSDEWIRPIFFPEQPGTYRFELTVSSPIAVSPQAGVAIEVTEPERGAAQDSHATR